MKSGSTVSASHRQPGRTLSTAALASRQKPSGTSGATSQRKPSTMDAQYFSVSI